MSKLYRNVRRRTMMMYVNLYFKQSYHVNCLELASPKWCH